MPRNKEELLWSGRMPVLFPDIVYPHGGNIAFITYLKAPVAPEITAFYLPEPTPGQILAYLFDIGFFGKKTL